DGEAREMLVAMLGADRIAAEPRAAAEVARLCGNLPLALRLVAANLATHPHSSIGDHGARLTGSRLDALEGAGGAASGGRAAFDLPPDALPPDARRLFRLLGLVPGPDFTPAAAAALAGTDPESGARLLERLAVAHAADEHAPGRYRLHDLLRHYAAERASA